MAQKFTQNFAPGTFAPVNTLQNRIKTLRGETSQTEFARSLGVTPSTLGRYERGESTPDADFIGKICKYLEINPYWLLFGEGPMRPGENRTGGANFFPHLACDKEPYKTNTQADFSRLQGPDGELVLVPLVKARLAAGTGSFETSDEVDRRYAFRTGFLSRRGNPSRMVLMRVAGDSMEPEIKSDDVVLIDQSQTEPTPGQVYAVGIEDAVYIKVIDFLPGKVVLKSANPAYPPIEVDARLDLADGVRIIGHVIWIGRELR